MPNFPSIYLELQELWRRLRGLEINIAELGASIDDILRRIHCIEYDPDFEGGAEVIECSLFVSGSTFLGDDKSTDKLRVVADQAVFDVDYGINVRIEPPDTPGEEESPVVPYPIITAGLKPFTDGPLANADVPIGRFGLFYNGYCQLSIGLPYEPPTANFDLEDFYCGNADDPQFDIRLYQPDGSTFAQPFIVNANKSIYGSVTQAVFFGVNRGDGRQSALLIDGDASLHAENAPQNPPLNFEQAGSVNIKAGDAWDIPDSADGASGGDVNILAGSKRLWLNNASGAGRHGDVNIKPGGGFVTTKENQYGRYTELDVLGGVLKINPKSLEMQCQDPVADPNGGTVGGNTTPFNWWEYYGGNSNPDNSWYNGNWWLNFFDLEDSSYVQRYGILIGTEMGPFPGENEPCDPATTWRQLQGYGILINGSITPYSGYKSSLGEVHKPWMNIYSHSMNVQSVAYQRVENDLFEDENYWLNDTNNEFIRANNNFIFVTSGSNYDGSATTISGDMNNILAFNKPYLDARLEMPEQGTRFTLVMDPMLDLDCSLILYDTAYTQTSAYYGSNTNNRVSPGTRLSTNYVVLKPGDSIEFMVVKVGKSNINGSVYDLNNDYLDDCLAIELSRSIKYRPSSWDYSAWW